MRKLIVALAVATLALAGCIKVSTTPPTDLPAYVRIMPGGQQFMTMDMGPLKAEVFLTTTSSDDVMTYYRTQAQGDGLAESAAPAQANATADQKQVSFADAASGRTLIVVTKPQNGQTMVELIYKPVAAGQAPANTAS
jgi:hypothetical protein